MCCFSEQNEQNEQNEKQNPLNSRALSAEAYHQPPDQDGPDRSGQLAGMRL